VSDSGLTASLTVVLGVARAIALAGHDVPISWWSPIAFLWHDAAVVLLFAAIERAAAAIARRAEPRYSAVSARAAAICLYAAIVFYVAVNVPVTRVLSTPLTWTMWRAARGPLSDSILLYATWDNVSLTMTVVGLAIGLPFALEWPRVAQPFRAAIRLAQTPNHDTFSSPCPTNTERPPTRTRVMAPFWLSIEI